MVVHPTKAKVTVMTVIASPPTVNHARTGRAKLFLHPTTTGGPARARRAARASRDGRRAVRVRPDAMASTVEMRLARHAGTAVATVTTARTPSHTATRPWKEIPPVLSPTARAAPPASGGPVGAPSAPPPALAPPPRRTA